MNALEKVVDLLASVTILFLLPLLYYSSGIHVSQAILAGQAGENFLKRVSTSGNITLPVWKELEDTLARYGCTAYELQRERRLFEPVGEAGMVAERICTEEKDGLWKEVREEGKSRLQKGDRLRLILYVNEVPTMYCAFVRTGDVNP